ncbi:alpha/beta hydrolase [Kutzneria viridogrisea]|uniref:Acetyl esterase/lipase n=1 Tax=Kutzneria viridogrisea TaxID=47990 RepID=A0ABR6BTH2_9PSEU|nr:acetyl esterase/lipase [Kutzneria viridogrisea]
MPDIDQDLKRFLEAFPPLSVSAPGVDILRARAELEGRWQRVQPMVDMASVTDRSVPGDPPVPVRVYRPLPGARPLPVVVFFHGGGWCMGSTTTHDDLARRIARGAGAVVVSADYRLAPEHPFPAAVDDAWTVLRWVGEHAAELGGDPARIAVAGDSAGGNLAAVTALLARDNGGPRLRFQLLYYPATGAGEDLPARRENATAPVLSTADIETFLEHYAGGLPGPVPWTLSPALAEDLSGLPPAYIATAQFDPLRDEGEVYGQLLAKAGVPVQVRRHEDLVHAFASFAPIIPACGRAVDESVSALRAALA